MKKMNYIIKKRFGREEEKVIASDFQMVGTFVVFVAKCNSSVSERVAAYSQDEIVSITIETPEVPK